MITDQFLSTKRRKRERADSSSNENAVILADDNTLAVGKMSSNLTDRSYAGR